MGRGRQKAKHQKVARELKYHSTSIDISALERELSGSRDEDGYAQHYGAQHYGSSLDDTEDEDDASDYVSPSRGF